MRRWTSALTVLCALACAGCGQQLGAMLWWLTESGPKKVEAKYRLPPGSVLVLVDDDQGLIRPATARFALVEAMARELKAHNLAEKVTTNEELTRLRQSEPKFDQRGAREVGQMAQADTVLWLSTQEFTMDDELEISSVPGKFSVAVRVINAKAEDKKQVRLWPPELAEREGRLVEATVASHELRDVKSPQEAHQKLAEALAVKVTELFYDRQVEE